jgi:serine/threonine protein kinase
MSNLILSRYIPKEELGHGSFGKLICAIDTKNFNKEVAVKIVITLVI